MMIDIALCTITHARVSGNEAPCPGTQTERFQLLGFLTLTHWWQTNTGTSDKIWSARRLNFQTELFVRERWHECLIGTICLEVNICDLLLLFSARFHKLGRFWGTEQCNACKFIGGQWAVNMSSWVHIRLFIVASKSIGEPISRGFDLYNLSACGMGFKRGQNRLQFISKVDEIVYNFKFTIERNLNINRKCTTAGAVVNNFRVSEWGKTRKSFRHDVQSPISTLFTIFFWL